MSIYLYNLEFLLTGSNVNAGSFEPCPSVIPPTASIANTSCAWFEYTAGGSPPGLEPYFQVVNQALNSSQWGNAQSDANNLDLNPGDYLMVRVFSADPKVSTYQMRFTGVFGRGTSQLLPTGAGNLQSPLVMSTPSTNSSLPRTVIDVDGSLGSSWPAPLGDGSWVTCLGEVVGAPGDAANDYTFNVGASVYLSSSGNTYTFGRDPRMHVSGVGKPSVVAA